MSAPACPAQPPFEDLRIGPALKAVCVLGCNPSPYTLNGTNCYLLGHGAQRVLVDTGGSATSRDFVRNLRAAMVATGALGLASVILTHEHDDHVGGLSAVTSEFGTMPVYKLSTARDRAPAPAGATPLHDGQHLDLHGVSLEVMHTPGHTSDSICLWHAPSRTLLCADTLLGWGSTTVSDLGDYMKSLDALRALDPPPLAMLPGHGPPVVPQQQGATPLQVIQQYIDHRNARISQVLAAVQTLSAQGRPPAELRTRHVTEQVYPGLASPLIGGADANTLQALLLLEQRGFVSQVGGGWQLCAASSL